MRKVVLIGLLLQIRRFGFSKKNRISEWRNNKLFWFLRFKLVMRTAKRAFIGYIPIHFLFCTVCAKVPSTSGTILPVSATSMTFRTWSHINLLNSFISLQRYCLLFLRTEPNSIILRSQQSGWLKNIFPVFDPIPQLHQRCLSFWINYLPVMLEMEMEDRWR